MKDKLTIGRIVGLLILFLSSGIYAQVGIGNTNPNSDALLEIGDATTTTKGFILPRVNLTGTSNTAPMSSHIQGMVVYNKNTSGDVSPGIYINNGSNWERVEDLSPAASSVSLTGDIEISSSTFSNVPGISSLTFTARKSSVLVMLTASGFGYTNSMSYVQLRVRNTTSGTTVGGTNTSIQSYDDVTGTITTWSASFSKLLTGLTIGNSYTLQVQGSANGILGVPNAALYTTSFPDSQHMTLTVIH